MSKLPILLTAVVSAAVLAPAGPARADASLVAVAPFAGPEAVASEARAVVVQVVGARYPMVPPAELEDARALTETDGVEPSAALTVARLAGADAVVVGRVAPAGEAYALSLSVLRARNGENVGAVLVPLDAAEITPAARDRIERLFGNLLAWIDPDASPPGSAAARAEGAVVDKLEVPGEADEREAPAQPDKLEVTDKADRPKAVAAVQARKKPTGDQNSGLRFPIAFAASVGLTANARRLAFSQEPGLADASLSANPSPGLRVEVEAATVGEPGIGLTASLDRSIGANVALGGAGGFELPVTQKQWAVALHGRMRVRKRWLPTIDLGYSELSYQVGVRPPELLVPDARYAFLDVGAGTRLELGLASLFGGLHYLHTVATSGITDTASFGGAGTYGVAAEAGVEVEVARSFLIRAGARYLRFVLDFEGTGDLAVALDGDLDQDVIGAVDAFVGGYAQIVYRF